MCCPLASRKNRAEEFRKYPGMIGFYVKNAQTYLNTHPQSKINGMFNNAEEWLTFTLLCENLAEWETMITPDLFGYSFSAKDWLKKTYNFG